MESITHSYTVMDIIRLYKEEREIIMKALADLKESIDKIEQLEASSPKGDITRLKKKMVRVDSLETSFKDLENRIIQVYDLMGSNQSLLQQEITNLQMTNKDIIRNQGNIEQKIELMNQFSKLLESSITQIKTDMHGMRAVPCGASHCTPPTPVPPAAVRVSTITTRRGTPMLSSSMHISEETVTLRILCKSYK